MPENIRSTIREPLPLAPRQKDVYDAIVAFCKAHKRPPNQSDIAAAVGIKQAGISSHVHYLERKGWITVEKTKSLVYLHPLERFIPS